MSKGRRGLGRGLDALLQSTQEPAETEPHGEAESRARTEAMRVAIGAIQPNPYQPRQHFDERALDELADSIREHGLIQPLLVRPEGEGYVLIAGERRWQASQRAGLTEVPVVLREATPQQMLALAIIENVQRADLNPVEEAQGYRQLMDRFGHTQEKLAEALGKSRSHIANLLRLLNLPDEVLGYLRDGKLSAGHARALVVVENPAALARRVVAEGLSVREVEKLAKGATGPERRQAPRTPEKDADTRALEGELSANLRMKVAIEHKDGAGTVTIRFTSLEELDDLCRILSAG